MGLPKTIEPRPSSGDGTSRGGYGAAIYARDGYRCAYCGLEMGISFERWLELSVDHVVPESAKAHVANPDWIASASNLVTCCRACNEFGNRYKLGPDVGAVDEAGFIALRDRVFQERRGVILGRRDAAFDAYRKQMGRPAGASDAISAKQTGRGS